ncbi:MAG: flippase [Syntrophaceae bacterium]|nr:flippase [Syntrophaceae bacterium]
MAGVNGSDMGTKSQLFKNTIALSVPSGVNPFVSFLLIMVISRSLGAQGLGEYSLVLAWQAIFVTIASMGLGALVIRETSRKPEAIHSFFINSIMFGLLSSVLAIGAMVTTIKLMGYPHKILVCGTISALSLIPSTAIRYVEAIFRSKEKSEYLAICYLAENIIRVALSVILLLSGFDLLWVFLAITFVNFMTLLGMMFFYVRIIGVPRWSFDLNILRLMAKQGPTFLSIAIFSTLHLSMPQIMLSKLLDIESVGIFSAASRVMSFAEVIPIGFCMALLPAMTKKYEQGIDELRDITTDSLRYAFIFIFPIIIGSVILADPIIHIIFGSKFEASPPVLRLLAFGTAPYFVLVSLAQVLVSTDNQSYDLKVNLLAVVLSFVFHILFVSIFGVIGASVATVLCLAILNQVQYKFIKKNLFELNFWAISFKPLLATAFMAPVTFLMRDYNVILNIFASAIFYGLCIVLLKGLTDEELGKLFSILKKKTA